jgi:hypothetical protein
MILDVPVSLSLILSMIHLLPDTCLFENKCIAGPLRIQLPYLLKEAPGTIVQKEHAMGRKSTNNDRHLY